MTEKRFGFATLPSPTMRNVPEHRPSCITVLVIGQPRGGTSVVAAVLDALGVYMGPPNELRNVGSFENFMMCHGSDQHKAVEIERINSQHKVWGWKQPYGSSVLETLPKTVRNPYCIFIVRDVVALAQAYMKHARTDLAAAGQWAREQNARLVGHVFGTNLPSLLVSYERLLVRPRAFVESVRLFLGIDPGPKAFDEAVSRISPVGGYVVMPQTYGWPPAPLPHTTPKKWGKSA